MNSDASNSNALRRNICTKSKSVAVSVICEGGARSSHSGQRKTTRSMEKLTLQILFFFSFGHCQSHNRRKFNSMSSDFLGVCCFSPSSYCLIGKNEKKSLFALEREMTPANSGCSAIIVKNLNESPICRAAFPLLSFFSLII